MGVVLKEIQKIVLAYLRRPAKIFTILLLDDPHQKELIQFDKGRQLYSQSWISQQKEWQSKLFPISLDKAYDQSLDARDKHFHLIEEPFAHLMTNDGENEYYKAAWINIQLSTLSGRGLWPTKMTG